MKKSESKPIYIVIGLVIGLSIIGMIFTSRFGESSKENPSKKDLESRTEVIQVRTDKLGLDDLHRVFKKEYPNSFIKEIKYNDINGDIYYEVEGQDDRTEQEITISSKKEIINKEEKELEFQSEFKAKLKGFDLEDIKKLKPTKEIIEAVGKERTGEIESLKLSKRKGRFIFDARIDGVDIIIDGESKEILRTKD